MAASDAKPIPQKNVAYRVTFPIFDADGDLVTGAAGLDSEISKDGGTFADCTNEATEIATSSGMYYLDLSSTEMNADTVAIIVKTSTSGAKTTPIVMYPEEAGNIRVNVTQWKDATAPAMTGDAYARLGAPAGASVSADVAAVKSQTAAIEADTQDLQTQIGTDGAGLTNMPWNPAWDAEVQSECNDAITASEPIEVNITHINGTEITGDGDATPWGPA